LRIDAPREIEGLQWASIIAGMQWKAMKVLGRLSLFFTYCTPYGNKITSEDTAE
jgi:hypothetical protein